MWFPARCRRRKQAHREMSLLEIKVFGSAALRKTARPVREVDDEVRRLVDSMFDTMYAAEGIGLAGPQVGADLRVIVMDVGPSDPSMQPMMMINPELVWSEGEVVADEGCLSLPEINAEVKRSAQVRVRALDRFGETYEKTLAGIASRVAQHEMDHLDGVLLVDRVSSLKRNLLRGQLRRLRREGKRQKPDLVLVGGDKAVEAGR